MATSRRRMPLGFYLAALGRALAGARRYEDASTPLGKANEILTAELTADHDDSRTSAIVTGFVLTPGPGRLAEVDALFSRLFAHPFTQPQDEAHAKLRLGILRDAQGRQAEAQSLLGRGRGVLLDDYAARELRGGARRTRRSAGRSGLATDAFDTLMRAMTLFGKLQPNPSPDRADVLVSLSRAQITMGRSDGAVASAAQAAAFWQSFDSTGRSSGVASLWRARALHAAGRRDEAAESLRKASGILTSAGTTAERALLKKRNTTCVRHRRWGVAELRSDAHEPTSTCRTWSRWASLWQPSEPQPRNQDDVDDDRR